MATLILPSVHQSTAHRPTINIIRPRKQKAEASGLPGHKGIAKSRPNQVEENKKRWTHFVLGHVIPARIGLYEEWGANVAVVFMMHFACRINLCCLPATARQAGRQLAPHTTHNTTSYNTSRLFSVECCRFDKLLTIPWRYLSIPTVFKCIWSYGGTRVLLYIYIDRFAKFINLYKMLV